MWLSHLSPALALHSQQLPPRVCGLSGRSGRFRASTRRLGARRARVRTHGARKRLRRFHPLPRRRRRRVELGVHRRRMRRTHPALQRAILGLARGGGTEEEETAGGCAMCTRRARRDHSWRAQAASITDHPRRVGRGPRNHVDWRMKK